VCTAHVYVYLLRPDPNDIQGFMGRYKKPTA
jgi:hypothetical protein